MSEVYVLLHEDGPDGSAYVRGVYSTVELATAALEEREVVSQGEYLADHPLLLTHRPLGRDEWFGPRKPGSEGDTVERFNWKSHYASGACCSVERWEVREPLANVGQT